MRLFLFVPVIGLVLTIWYCNVYKPDSSTWCYVFRNSGWLTGLNIVTAIIALFISIH